MSPSPDEVKAPQDWSTDQVGEITCFKQQEKRYCSINYILNQQRAWHFHRIDAVITELQLQNKTPVDSSSLTCTFQDD